MILPGSGSRLPHRHLHALAHVHTGPPFEGITGFPLPTRVATTTSNTPPAAEAAAWDAAGSASHSITMGSGLSSSTTRSKGSSKSNGSKSTSQSGAVSADQGSAKTRGLYNSKNVCYMNVVVQCLSHSPFVVPTFLVAYPPAPGSVSVSEATTRAAGVIGTYLDATIKDNDPVRAAEAVNAAAAQRTTSKRGTRRLLNFAKAFTKITTSACQVLSPSSTTHSSSHVGETYTKLLLALHGAGGGGGGGGSSSSSSAATFQGTSVDPYDFKQALDQADVRRQFIGFKNQHDAFEYLMDGIIPALHAALLSSPYTKQMSLSAQDGTATSIDNTTHSGNASASVSRAASRGPSRRGSHMQQHQPSSSSSNTLSTPAPDATAGGRRSSLSIPTGDQIVRRSSLNIPGADDSGGRNSIVGGRGRTNLLSPQPPSVSKGRASSDAKAAPDAASAASVGDDNDDDQRDLRDRPRAKSFCRPADAEGGGAILPGPDSGTAASPQQQAQRQQQKMQQLRQQMMQRRLSAGGGRGGQQRRKSKFYMPELRRMGEDVHYKFLQQFGRSLFSTKFMGVFVQAYVCERCQEPFANTTLFSTFRHLDIPLSEPRAQQARRRSQVAATAAKAAAPPGSDGSSSSLSAPSKLLPSMSSPNVLKDADKQTNALSSASDVYATGGSELDLCSDEQQQLSLDRVSSLPMSDRLGTSPPQVAWTLDDLLEDVTYTNKYRVVRAAGDAAGSSSDDDDDDAQASEQNVKQDMDEELILQRQPSSDRQMYCSSCAKMRGRVRYQRVWKRPEVLIVRLRRADPEDTDAAAAQATTGSDRRRSDASSGSGRGSVSKAVKKNTRPIVIPLKGLRGLECDAEDDDDDHDYRKFRHTEQLRQQCEQEQKQQQQEQQQEQQSTLDMSQLPRTRANGDRIYHLYAVISHTGPATSNGHYVAHIRDEATERWHTYNDDAVTPLELPRATDGGAATTMTSSGAYVLFYALRPYPAIAPALAVSAAPPVRTSSDSASGDGRGSRMRDDSGGGSSSSSSSSQLYGSPDGRRTVVANSSLVSCIFPPCPGAQVFHPDEL